jgi:hypothetical protein
MNVFQKNAIIPNAIFIKYQFVLLHMLLKLKVLHHHAVQNMVNVSATSNFVLTNHQHVTQAAVILLLLSQVIAAQHTLNVNVTFLAYSHVKMNLTLATLKARLKLLVLIGSWIKRNVRLVNVVALVTFTLEMSVKVNA